MILIKKKRNLKKTFKNEPFVSQELNDYKETSMKNEK